MNLITNSTEKIPPRKKKKNYFMNQSRNSLPVCFITLEPIVGQNEPTKIWGAHDGEYEQCGLSACGGV
jgi:hypothetical protein